MGEEKRRGGGEGEKGRAKKVRKQISLLPTMAAGHDESEVETE